MKNDTIFQLEGNDETIFNISPGMEKYVSMWLSETNEELDMLESVIIAYEKNPQEKKYINELFKLFHRIKSSSAAMGFRTLAYIAHSFETILSRLRDNQITIDEKIIKCLYDTKDYYIQCVNSIKTDQKLVPQYNHLTLFFSTFIPHTDNSSNSLSSEQQVQTPLSDEESNFIETLMPNNCNLWRLVIGLEKSATLADLRYKMVIDNLRLEVSIVHTYPDIKTTKFNFDDDTHLSIIFYSDRSYDELIVLCQFDFVIINSLYLLSNSTKNIKNKNQYNTTIASHRNSETIRVDTIRLDNLINNTVELTITTSRLMQQAKLITKELENITVDRYCQNNFSFKTEYNMSQGTMIVSSNENDRYNTTMELLAQLQSHVHTFYDSMNELHQRTSLVQTNVMNLRMVAIGPLFQRFHRIVQDLCRQMNRKAELVIEGENTELDKKLIDELTNPLTHLIRNAVDHGIESPLERKIANKSESGTIKLEAFHEAGQVCIRITDDGQGLHIDNIRAQAVKNKLVSQDAEKNLTISEMYDLIFLPGFSTAPTITDISGRGIGLDIVKSKIKELKGKIDVESTKGLGTSFTLRLPLTVAILNSLLVSIGSTRYAIALESIQAVVNIGQHKLYTLENMTSFIDIDQEAVALIDLHSVLHTEPLTCDERSQHGIVIRLKEKLFAIRIDSVLSIQEVVVKSLPAQYKNIQGISGITILGDGELAFILDVNILHDVLESNPAKPYEQPFCI